MARGPSAAWYDADDVEYLDSDKVARDHLRGVLVNSLQARIEALEEAPTEELKQEVCRQSAAAAVDGEPGVSRRLYDLLVALYEAEEESRRVV